MEFNRRDLLKYFGAGAAVVPIIGGVPELKAEANLVQPAQVVPPMSPSGELTGCPHLYDALMGRKIIRMMVVLQSDRGRSTWEGRCIASQVKTSSSIYDQSNQVEVTMVSLDK